ncbi:fibril protein [Pyxidicoccus xibeiensis]|uniref:fibril protein n=1 Tax=Pyxidicoccus xibeiensis TaxID=2906759 RepID=UPI0020A7D587|nr:fibril protein [Pyxidicoccus xibeiensis]MCP3136845.1 fibril protein [Pyxidicoccus xibeiensis]
MFPLRVACVGLVLLTACASSNKSASPAREARARTAAAPGGELLSYGFDPRDPVRVGWGNQGVLAFLELLRGPQGQRIAWRRVGPCCEADASPSRAPSLEVFEVTYEGLATPVRLYLDPHHGDAIYAPQGFTIEGLTSRAPPPAEEQPEVIEL